MGETTGGEVSYLEPNKSKMFTLEFWTELDALESMFRSINVGYDDFYDFVGSHAMSKISISAFFTYTFACFGGGSLKFEKMSWLTFCLTSVVAIFFSTLTSFTLSLSSSLRMNG